MEEENEKLSSKIIPHQQIGLNRAGRPAGTPNKATMAAREAVAMFVENNITRLQDWLDMIANGYEIKEIDADGKTETTKRVQPNPIQAYELFMKVIEYHVPKLTRSENKTVIEQNATVKISSDDDALKAYVGMVKGQINPDDIMT